MDGLDMHDLDYSLLILQSPSRHDQWLMSDDERRELGLRAKAKSAGLPSDSFCCILILLQAWSHSWRQVAEFHAIISRTGEVEYAVVGQGPATWGTLPGGSRLRLYVVTKDICI